MSPTTSRAVVRRALAAAAAAFLAACGDGDPTATSVGGSIRGTVTDNAGAPVVSAVMVLSGNAQADRSTSSGSDGVYTFSNVPAGTYAVTVAPPTGFLAGAAAKTSVTVSSGAVANAPAFVLARTGPDTCLVARPDFGGPATAADRALFAYDKSAPLNLQQTLESTSDGIEMWRISYTSPDGGSVPGIVAVPVGLTGLRPGIVVMHPSGFPATIMQGYAKMLAHRGAVVIGIDAPYFRRGGNALPRFTSGDRSEQIQLIKDLQRAVDVLVARPDVDASRIAFEGYSFGAMIGAHFVGIEKRLKAASIQAGYGGHVTHVTNASNMNFFGNVPCGTRNAWLREMVPVEPIRFIGGASGIVLLFQIARLDTAVLPADAEALFNLAPNPKEVLYYDTGHNFNAQAIQDRHNWLAKQLGLDQ